MIKSNSKKALFAAALAMLSFTGIASNAQTAFPPVVAVVNGENIPFDEWVLKMQYMRFSDFVTSTNPLRAKANVAGYIALDALISGRIVMQYAKKVGLVATPAEIESEFAAIKLQPAIAKALESKQFTEAQVKEDIKLQRTLFNVATVNQRLTPEEVNLYYNSHPELYGTPEQWKLGAIRVAGKAKADEVVTALKTKPFAEVASTMSEENASSKRGGELGTFNVTDPGIPGYIKNAVAKMNVGDVSGIIESDLGSAAKPVYFIVRLLAKTERTMQPLDKVRSQVERTAFFEKVGGGAAKIAEISKGIVIDVKLPGYEALSKK